MKKQSIKINDNLFVNVIQVDKPKPTEKKVIRPDQFLIFDRSGSMAGYLDRIVEYARNYVQSLPEGTAVYLGWFSHVNQYSVSTSYLLQKELAAANNTIGMMNNALSMTCFDQVIDKTAEIIKSSGRPAAIYFFTDGCHNTSNFRDNVLPAMERLKSAGTVDFMAVGYGNIDRAQLVLMAEKSDGSFEHLEDFKALPGTLEDFKELADGTLGEERIDAGVWGIFPVSIRGKQVSSEREENGIIEYRIPENGFSGLFFATEKIPNGYEISEMNISIERGIRALTMIESQRNRPNVALELMNYLKDFHLTQMLQTAFTPDECARVEGHIKKSVFSKNARYMEGKTGIDFSKQDQFCVMDALQLLMETKGTAFYPSHPAMAYRRVSIKTVQDDGGKFMPTFEAVYFGNVIFHEKRLNIGFTTVQSGVVDLSPDNYRKNPFTMNDLKTHGLNLVFPVKRFRTYNVIQDGYLNTKKLVVSGIESIPQLMNLAEPLEGRKYLLDFTRIPVLNKGILKHSTASSLSHLAWSLKVVDDQLSVLRFMIKNVSEKLDKVETWGNFSEETVKFLKERCYIGRDGSYNPPVVKQESFDAYLARTFEIKIKGFSKASASDVIKKINAGGTPTQREFFIGSSYKKYVNEFGEDFEMLNDEFDRMQVWKRNMSFDLQNSKIAIALINHGALPEFSDRGNMELTKTKEVDVPVPVTFKFEYGIDEIEI